ncbi:hypothetical protein GDO81_017339 [Engystomops pustulosus]|uniref:Neurochondrin n=1 Tax=Engystomops pustulosus TaxID=76066 RepID=A0AAV7ADL4_ENGPU|nr:hypothetical protein GDO81_017339 [Engystomops pustulosus]
MPKPATHLPHAQSGVCGGKEGVVNLPHWGSFTKGPDRARSSGFPMISNLWRIAPGFWRTQSDFVESVLAFTRQKPSDNPTDPEKTRNLKKNLCRKICSHMHRKEAGDLRRTSAQQRHLLDIGHTNLMNPGKSASENAPGSQLDRVGWERIEDPFLLASVRLLGVWLAEETSCLRQEVIQLLPFLVHYMQTWFQRGVAYRNQLKEASEMALLSSSWGGLWPGDAIRFLLPALCHLSAEETSRKILISEGVPALLCEYYQLKWQILSCEEELTPESKSEAQLSLQSCCGVFLNLVVTEPILVCQEPCFVDLLKLLMQSLPLQLIKENQLILVANMSTLGLMMIRLLASSPGNNS